MICAMEKNQVGKGGRKVAARYSFKWSHWGLTDFCRSLKEQGVQKFRGQSVSVGTEGPKGQPYKEACVPGAL